MTLGLKLGLEYVDGTLLIVGVALGWYDTVGELVGDEDGVLVGRCVGLKEGFLLGLLDVVGEKDIDGLPDGARLIEGASDRDDEGLCDNNLDGWSDDETLGFDVGLLVNATEGIDDGALIGVIDGAVEIETVGVDDGVSEGIIDIVGFADGDLVGGKEGLVDIVGEWVGAAVGDSQIINESHLFWPPSNTPSQLFTKSSLLSQALSLAPNGMKITSGCTKIAGPKLARLDEKIFCCV